MLRPEGYLASARISFRQQFAYRAAALWGMVTNLFFGALRIAVLLAFVGSGEPSGFDAATAITYVALTQVFIGAFALFGWSDFMRTVHSGEVATQLLRPHSIYGAWLAQDAGRAGAQFLIRGLPMLVLFQLLWGLTWPASLAQWGLLTLAVLLAWLVGFGFRFAVNTLAFWSPDASGFAQFAWIAMMFASGFLMPLALFPETVQGLLVLTPFPSMLNTLVDLWSGRATGAAAWALIGQQLFWAATLNALAAWLLARGLRRLEVAGG